MKLLRSILSNLASLGLAFILALIIWVTATRAQDPTRSQILQIPVTFENLPENGILISPGSETVQVQIEGPDSVLRTISPRDFQVTANAANVALGVESPAPVSVTTTADVRMSDPLPDQVNVLIEALVTRAVPIQLDIRGSTARGHTQGEPLIEPASIAVSGPASRVEPFDFGLVTIFLNSARETQVGEHRPIFYDQQGRVVGTNGLTIRDENVQVTIPVVESEGFAEKLITVDWEGDPAPGYRLLNVSVDPPSVLVQGPPARVNALTRLQTEAIDITGLAETFEQQVTLELPTGVTLDQDQPIRVRIEIEPILTIGIRERPVELLGLSETVEAAVDPETVRVVLFGPVAALDSLVDEDIRVTADLFELESGTYSVEPEVDLPDRGIEVRSVQPNRVTVTVTETLTTTQESRLFRLPQQPGAPTAVADPGGSPATPAPYPHLPTPRPLWATAVDLPLERKNT